MLQFIPSTVSTQDDLHALAAAGAPEGTAVVAMAQTSGRGSRGRRWSSPPGGLWMSVLCRPETAPALEMLSLRVALASCAVLESRLPGIRLGIKWPNDIMRQGRKLGGILCEARWQGGTVGWVAVGIGMNVLNEIPLELSAVATNLGDLTPVPSTAVLAPLVASAIVQASQVSDALSQAELATYHSRDWLLGRELSEPSVGRAAGITLRGELQVADAQGALTCHRSGTVVLGGIPR